MKTNKSWRTTLASAVAALGQILTVSLPHEYSWVGPAVTGIGLLLLGGNSRDEKASIAVAEANNLKQ